MWEVTIRDKNGFERVVLVNAFEPEDAARIAYRDNAGVDDVIVDICVSEEE